MEEGLPCQGSAGKPQLHWQGAPPPTRAPHSQRPAAEAGLRQEQPPVCLQGSQQPVAALGLWVTGPEVQAVGSAPPALRHTNPPPPSSLPPALKHRLEARVQLICARRPGKGPPQADWLYFSPPALPGHTCPLPLRGPCSLGFWEPTRGGSWGGGAGTEEEMRTIAAGSAES